MASTYGSLRGLNTHQRAEVGFLVGVLRKPRSALEALAAVLARRPIVGAAPGRRYDTCKVWIRVKTSTGQAREDMQRQAVWGMTHADPVADALVRAQIYGELVQAEGRYRGVRRGAGVPVDIIHMTGLLIPNAVYSVLGFAELHVDDFSSLSPRGRILQAIWRGDIGQSLAEWARLCGEDVNAIKMARRNDSALGELMDSLAAERAKELAIQAMVQTEGKEDADEARGTRADVVRTTLALLLDAGFSIETAAETKRAKAEVERRCKADGIELDRTTWDRSLKRLRAA